MRSGSIVLSKIQDWVNSRIDLAERQQDEDMIPSGVQTLEHFDIPFLVFGKDLGRDPIPVSWSEKIKGLDYINVFPGNKGFIFVQLGGQQFLVVEGTDEQSVVVVPSYWIDFR
jgi:hypothetical protein